MESREALNIKGHINVKLYDENMNLKSEVDKHNVITTVGKNFLAAWLAAASQANPFMSYMALGSDTAAADASDTDLGSQLGSRVVGSLSSSTNTWTNQATFGPGVATGAVTEAGLFSASTGGTLFARQTFAVQNKLAGDTIVFTWNVSIS